MFPTRYRDPHFLPPPFPQISTSYHLLHTAPIPSTVTTHQRQNQKEKEKKNQLFDSPSAVVVPVMYSGTNHHDSSTVPMRDACTRQVHILLLAHCRYARGANPLPTRRSTPPRYKISQNGKKHTPLRSQDPLQQIVVVVVPTKKHANHTDANARRHNTIITITSSTCPSPCPSSPPQPPPPQRQPWSTGSPCRCRTAPGRPCRHSP